MSRGDIPQKTRVILKVGDLVAINDLCAKLALVGTLGTVVETDIKEEWHSWPLASVLTTEGLIRFRQDSPQLKVISESL